MIQDFNAKSMLFNAAAGIVMLATVFYMVRSALVGETVTPCSQRYPSPVEFSLDNGRGPMTTIQLVGAIGTSQRGIYRNASAVSVRGIPGEVGLKVSMSPAAGEGGKKTDGNGIAFNWSPTGFAGANSACLAYSVFLPKNFEFGGGGVLPGLYAGELLPLDAASDGKRGVAQRFVWRNNGRANLYAQIPGFDATGGAYLSNEGVELPKGRWVAVEQEVVLNSKGKPDGLARLFVDGELAFEKSFIEWRRNDKLTFNGVLADIGYAMPRREIGPPKETAIFLSPLSLRWQ